MFDEDLSVFFDVDDFAITVSLNGKLVNGILTEEFVEANFVQTRSPVFIYCKLDVPEVVIDSILINGTQTFKVKGMQPDGTGLNMLTLEEQIG